MNNLEKYLDHNFPKLFLRKPVFYSWKIGIRFELGQSQTEGEAYFQEVERRANTLYESVFAPSDRVFVVQQSCIWKDSSPIDESSFFLNNIKYDTLEYQTLQGIYGHLYHDDEDQDPWLRTITNAMASKVNHQQLLKATANIDFSDRQPQAEGEVYIINTDKHIIFHMYDDRGLDIIAKDRAALQAIYSTYYDWILDYDRKAIDIVFKEANLQLSTLYYTQKWLDYGLLTEDQLQSQLAEYAKGEDTNTEHYRYGQFQSWLNSKDKLTDLEVEQLLELAKDDPDVTMAGSVVAKLFESHPLTDSQFEYIKSRLPEFGDWTAEIIERAALRRRLNREELTHELFHTILNSKHNVLTERIIDESNDEEILNHLIEHGPNKKIRNVAKQKLRKVKKGIKE